MNSKSIIENCEQVSHTGLHEFISVYDAKLRYQNRLNGGDSLTGFRFGVEELEQLIAQAKDQGALSLRFWKGRRKVHDVCPDPDNSDGTIQSPDFYIEDLIVMPVLEDGTDLYAEEGKGNYRVEDRANPDTILASSRPCPEWCNVKRLEDKVYFYDRSDLNVVQRTVPAVMNINHYLGKGCNVPEPDNS